METKNREIYDKLFQIYRKHKQKYRHNPDSEQMCCMWSTANPPDLITNTDPFFDIEETFDISLDEDDCMELYDMEVNDASLKIAEIIKQQS